MLLPAHSGKVELGKMVAKDIIGGPLLWGLLGSAATRTPSSVAYANAVLAGAARANAPDPHAVTHKFCVAVARAIAGCVFVSQWLLSRCVMAWAVFARGVCACADLLRLRVPAWCTS